MVGAVQSDEVRAGKRGSRLHEDVGEGVRRVGHHDRLARAGSHLLQGLAEADVDVDVFLEKAGSVRAGQRETCKEKHNIGVTEGIERIREELNACT